jgi:4-hydroxy-tetrahydrodipicolinate synthase
VKAALNMLGHDVGGLRLPLIEATEDEKTAVRAGLERAGVLTAARA